MEIVTDLMGVQTVLPIGKTAKLLQRTRATSLKTWFSISLDGGRRTRSITLNTTATATAFGVYGGLWG